jgi:LCP family protein required for cell wall assembly
VQETNTNQTNQLHQKPKSRKKRTVLWIVLSIAALALIGGGIYAWHVLKRPDVFFDQTARISAQSTPETTPAFDIEAYLPTAEPGTAPSLTAAPEETSGSAEQANESIPMTGIVNIALFGIDAYEDGTSTSGTMPHTDANMIVAINFEKKEVSLISIARDCLTTAPGHTGFYKFNGVFNVGGGMKDPKAGFELSSRAAEEWLGGVSVPYYYGVDFQAVIDLVDMIGGIDFDVEIRLTTLNGRTINPGRRHLDGNGVMAYMRMRKTADGLDSSRTARQRKMLIAIFKKLKQESKLSMIPDLLKTMGDNVYTNTSLTQTMSLVNFAQGLDEDSIRSYSIQGRMHYQYDWRYCFIDQQARIDILKEVYGIDAEPMRIDSLVYETFLYDSGFRAIQYLTIAQKLFAAIHELGPADAMSEEQKTAYAVCWKDYENLRDRFRAVDRWTQEHYDSTGFTKEEQQKRTNDYEELKALEAKLKESGDALNTLFRNPITLRWNRSIINWYKEDSDINDVYVDFR